MNSERNWQLKLAGRVLLNAFAGAIATAIVAVLCGGIVGLLADWIFNASSAALRVTLPPDITPYLMTRSLMGASLFVGFILGAIIFGVAAGKSSPGRALEPLYAIFGRVALGQVAAVLVGCATFLAVEGAKTALSGGPFVVTASLDMLWLAFGAPALMICGAIAGALSKRT